MTIFSPIPMPQSGMDAFASGATTSQSIIDAILKNKLIQPQADEMKGKAAQSSMMANLINKVLEGMNGGSGSNNNLNVNSGDLIAGLLGLPTQSQVVDGNSIRSNPITGTTVTKVGMSPTETEQMKSDVKKSSDLEDDALVLKNTLSNYQQMKDLLEIDPSLTGLSSGLMSKFHLSNNPNLASFQELQTKAQANLAKLGSQRGGIGALKWASGGKPNIYNSGDYNSGMIESTIKGLKNEWANINKEYQLKTGKPLSITLDDIAKEEDGNQFSQSQQPKENIENPPSQPEKLSPASRYLAKGLTLPNFKTKEEFQAWFTKQPKFVRDALRLKLKGGQ